MATSTETARKVILEALDDISVRMDESTLGASDGQTGMKAINRIMDSLLLDGINLGFTRLTSVTDIVTIDDGAIDALIMLLAFRLWPKYRTPQVSAVIIANAREAMKKMYRIGITITSSSYPNRLPTGSGNSRPGDTYDTFYPPEEASDSTGYWILKDGTWDDEGIWDDDAAWIDGD